VHDDSASHSASRRITGRPRADARRNRDQILVAARDVFSDRGPDAPLDEIARCAGVGNATLYRHFPDRLTLLRAVVLDLFARTHEAAHLALREEPDAFHALARYMHRALDLRIGAVMPALIGLVAQDEEVVRAREASRSVVQQMLEQARADRSLRPDVAFGDIGPVLIRLSRPLPGRLPRELDQSLAHRHLDLVIDGLRALPGRGVGTLRGPAMALEDFPARSSRSRAARDSSRWHDVQA
jgi:AcrR family transcriptional regulator